MCIACHKQIPDTTVILLYASILNIHRYSTCHHFASHWSPCVIPWSIFQVLHLDHSAREISTYTRHVRMKDQPIGPYQIQSVHENMKPAKKNVRAAGEYRQVSLALRSPPQALFSPYASLQCM